MKVIIFGATGLLGKEFKKQYSQISSCVVSTPTRSEVSLVEKQLVGEYIKKIQPQLVINCVAVKNADACEEDPFTAWENNAFVPALIAQALVQHAPHARLVHISSSEIFAGNTSQQFAEDEVPRPTSVYGWTKYTSEKMIQSILESAHIPYYILRTSWLYGEHKPTFIDVIIENLKNRQPTTLATDQYDIPIWTRDVVQATVQILDNSKAHSGIYHITPTVNDMVSRFDIAHYIAEVARLDPQMLQSTTRREIFTASRPEYSILTNSHTDIFTLPDWRQSLLEYMQKKHDIT